MKLTRQNVIKILVIIIILIISSYFVGYFLACSSEPYKQAKIFIQNNPEIINQIGHVINMKLDFWGYSVKYSGPRGLAKFNIDLKGSKGRATVFIMLDKKTDVWKILEASLKLENAKLIKIHSFKDNKG